METPLASAWLTVGVIVAALLYLRGFLYLRLTSRNFIPAWNGGSFFLGLLLIWVALGSSIAALDHELLTVHMIQHLLLMTFAAPFILLGAPVIGLLHGLPQPFRDIVKQTIQSGTSRRIANGVAQPVMCWLVATGVLMAWHIPALFNLGLRSEAWHSFEQASFLAGGLLFWWPVIQPWPGTSSGPDWSIVVYLFLATLPCDILSAFLVFSERVAYPVYLSAARHSSFTALEDQQCAGALMWTCVTVVYLVAAAILSTRLLSPHREFQGLEVL